MRNKFNATISETGYSQPWKHSALGVVYVSNSLPYTDQVIQSVVAYIENSREGVKLIRCDRQINSGF